VHEGARLEIAYRDDPVELFFLAQFRGSGGSGCPTVQLIKSLGGARIVCANGHPFRSIGVELCAPDGRLMIRIRFSAECDQDWVRRNPKTGAMLYQQSVPMCFFARFSSGCPRTKGRLARMNRFVQPLASHRRFDPSLYPSAGRLSLDRKPGLAVNRRCTAWMESRKDTGSAINGRSAGGCYVLCNRYEAGRTCRCISCADPGAN